MDSNNLLFKGERHFRNGEQHKQRCSGFFQDTLGAANDWLMGGWLKGRKKDEDKRVCRVNFWK